MVKKYRFPLIMDDGIEVRSSEELKEHFSVPLVMDYLKNGTLVRWLHDRSLNDMADQVQELDSEDPESIKRLCDILDVTHIDTAEYIQKETLKKQRILRMESCIKDENYKNTIDKMAEKIIGQVALDQNELYALLDNGVKEIYLCGDKFSIPLSAVGVTYTGINNPVAVIDSKEEVDWEKKRITLRNIVFDQKYLEILEEKRKAERISNVMVCMETKHLYKFNDENNRYATFYSFHDLDMPYRNAAQDEKNIYFMREKGKYTGKYEIVSLDLETGQEATVFDLERKEPMKILCIRKGKLFLRGQAPREDTFFSIDIHTHQSRAYTLDKDVTNIFIDETGENACFRVQHSPRINQEIYSFNLESKKKQPILFAYNILGIDMTNHYLMVWGKDTYKSASEEYYYYVYNTQTGDLKKYEGDSHFSTQALWRDAKTEYRLAVIQTNNLDEKYQLFETDTATGQEKPLCIVSRKYNGKECLDRKMRMWKGYLYLYCRSYSEDSVSGSGIGIGYEVNKIPPYRICLSDHKVQRYNGHIYENTLEWR